MTSVIVGAQQGRLDLSNTNEASGLVTYSSFQINLINSLSIQTKRASSFILVHIFNTCLPGDSIINLRLESYLTRRDSVMHAAIRLWVHSWIGIFETRVQIKRTHQPHFECCQTLFICNIINKEIDVHLIKEYLEGATKFKSFVSLYNLIQPQALKIHFPQYFLCLNTHTLYTCFTNKTITSHLPPFKALLNPAPKA